MAWFTSPRSFALNTFLNAGNATTFADFQTARLQHFNPIALAVTTQEEHPNFWHLSILVFEAVLEVVFVALPGYIVARQGLFDAESQKFLANLNILIFTPCLIFTKLAKQLTADRLVDLAIIPAIFAAQTLTSWTSSVLVAKCFRLKKRPANFVVAMGVFCNSNSIPISLVISLSKTISGLHWDRIPGDNDKEVAARGILYLLIFQQLGQLLRWTWGFNVLLKPKSAYTKEEGGDGSAFIEEGGEDDDTRTLATECTACSRDAANEQSGETTPLLLNQSPSTSKTPSVYGSSGDLSGIPQKCQHLADCNLYNDRSAYHGPEDDGQSYETRAHLNTVVSRTKSIWDGIRSMSYRAFSSLPHIFQNILRRSWSILFRVVRGFWRFMNPPLWSILAAIIVASVPALQKLLFEPGTFVNNSIIHGVEQSAGVAIPLILVVLGANLARNTLPPESLEEYDPAEPSDKKLLIASLISRMLLPTIIMAPIIALVAKYVPVSILDDPIFIIVVFLLTGAPSALQLAQICQLNNIYMSAISQLLFHSYAVWILPNTLILVTMALAVVKWAT